MKWNYLTVEESEMSADEIDLQIALGLQTCKTKQDVLDLLKDVRQHAREQVLRSLLGRRKYTSECCDASPLGELSPDKTGFCSKCGEGAIFILEEE